MMIESDAIAIYTDYVINSVGSFLPLFATISGIFIAFAIANMARFLILKMIK
jgi:hypothetical protein